MRQLIIARKDLNMSAGKLAAQVSHASMAFLTAPLRDAKGNKNKIKRIEDGEYVFEIKMDAETYDDWVCGIFTKTICEARNRNQLLKAKKMAEELGMEEGKDFFLIKDNCLTELEPEEIDENGVGQLMQIAINKAKPVRPDIKLGICGEHGGDPRTVEFCHRIGLTYVSCSPYRVPLARLAAAQAAVKEKMSK